MLIAQGELKVSLSLRGGKSIHLATLGRGQFLGEMSFLDGWPYSADVHALADTALICIDRQALDAIVANDGRTRASIFKTIAMAIAARLRSSSAAGTRCSISLRPPPAPDGAAPAATSGFSAGTRSSNAGGAIPGFQY